MVESVNSGVFFGESSLDELGCRLDAGEHHSILLVTGRSSYETSGASRLLAPALNGRQVTRVFDFQTNPQKSDLLRVLDEIKGVDFSAIIAVGGGSVMDVAKLIKCFAQANEQIDEVLYSASDATPSSVALFAIPTTAGSGSEATQFAVLYDRGTKYSVTHPKLLPDAAWVLPSLLSSVPQNIAAAAAMDSFCQGVESYWSIHSTDKSKELARQAICLSWDFMLPAVVDRDQAALEAMGEAAHLAGMAINLTKTTAAHSLSYALTAYFGLAHGHAVGLMLPDIYQYNEGVENDDILDLRGVGYVKRVMVEIALMLGHRSVQDAAEAIRERMKNLGMPNSLNAVGITDPTQRELLIEHGFNPDRVNNNPRKLSTQELRSILTVTS
ncbi:MAG: phosphonoacetaldehyde reductase [Akkermansiaceae bacterium]